MCNSCENNNKKERNQLTLRTLATFQIIFQGRMLECYVQNSRIKIKGRFMTTPSKILYQQQNCLKKISQEYFPIFYFIFCESEKGLMIYSNEYQKVSDTFKICDIIKNL